MSAANLTGRRWTSSDDDSLRQLAAAGLGAKEIADRLGRSHASITLRAARIDVRVPRSAPTRVRLLRVVLDRHGELSAAQMAEAMRCPRQHIYYAINWMRDRNEIRIVRWTRSTSGSPTPYYARGSGRDAPRPVPFSSGERTKKYVDRLREERPLDLIARYKRNNTRKSTRAPRRDAAASWINNRSNDE